MADRRQLEVLREGSHIWNKWRLENPYVIVDLSDAYLSGMNFSNANLNNADLRFSAISGSILIDADFRNADLTRANLSASYLSNANLSNAILTHAKLDNAIVMNTFFVSVNLSTASGLETLQHRGPSEISNHTLYLSEGNIPEQFLRGCGLRDWEIQSAKLYQSGLTPYQITEVFNSIFDLRADPLIQFFSCFISYSHVPEDKAFAVKLHKKLQESGVRCWLDEHQLLPGDDIYKEIDRGIRLSDKVLLCCSEHSLKSWWVDNEIQIAFDKEQQLRKDKGVETFALIPLNLDGYIFSGGWGSGKAAQIKSRVAADFTNWNTDQEKFEEPFERLMRALRINERAREASPEQEL